MNVDLLLIILIHSRRNVKPFLKCLSSRPNTRNVLEGMHDVIRSIVRTMNILEGMLDSIVKVIFVPWTLNPLLFKHGTI